MNRLMLLLCVGMLALSSCTLTSESAAATMQSLAATPAAEVAGSTQTARVENQSDQPPDPQEPAGQGQGPGGGTPPDAAYAACSAQSEGDACEFTSQKGAENGLCETVQDQLACSPQRGPVGSGDDPAGSNQADADGDAGITVTSPNLESFILSSPDVVEDGALPVEYTCDGASATLPLTWSGAPAETEGFAVVMHHSPGPGDTHWYWVVYDIPIDAASLPKNSAGIGMLGTNSVNSQTEYAPPCSKGPGEKVYTYTLYALSAQPQFSVPASQVSLDVLLNAIQDITLASAELNVTFTR